MFSSLLGAIIVALTVVASVSEATFTNVVYFTPTLYPTQSNTTYFVGQQVRVKLSASVPSANVGFNRTTVRMSVHAMYAGRALSGVPIPCNSSLSSVYFDSGNLGVKAYSTLGRYITYEAYASFTVPPFPYRICVLNRPAFKSQYYSVEGQNTVFPRNFTELGVYFRASAIMQEGDFAAIAITRVGASFPFAFTIPSTTNDGLDGDSVKLVPAGAACSIERTNSRETSQLVDFCGSNRVTSDGSWMGTNCLVENSVAGGVAKVGTNSLNPFVTTLGTSAGFPRVVNESAEQLIAYLQLPAYALYDVCYSPKTFRKVMYDRGETIGQPVWFKVMQFLPATCTRTACPSRTRLQITARIGTVTWSSLSSPIAGSYGSIRVRGAGDLNTNPATRWDPNCNNNCTKEYFNTTGGDMFRLVPFSEFFKTPDFTAASRVTITGATSTFGSAAERVVQGVGTTPSTGSVSPNAGCWVSTNDNYGTVETPMGSAACPSCETGLAGQTASGDLGGDSRSSENSWRQDLSNQFLSYARVRIPTVGGTWRVCYRKAGINNWQFLDWDTLITRPYQGFFQGAVTNMNILTPSQLNTNFTYVLNDTRRGTWAQFQVWSTTAVFETTPSSFFTTTVTQANVRGAMFKVIAATQRCDDVSQPAATSLDAGLPECLPQQCNYLNGTCYGCTGVSDNNAMLRRNLMFSVLLPANLSSVRVCLRNRVENWRIITMRWDRRPLLPLLEASDVAYNLSDYRSGSWGRFLFYRTGGGVIDTHTFTATRGSMFRIVPTSVRCDLIWTGTDGPQDFSNRTVDWHLGVTCSPSDTSYPCDSANTAPTIGGVIGSAPYTDLNPSTSGAYTTLASAFAVIPPASATYRVCFKEAKRSWAEVTPQLVPQAAPTFSVQGRQGMYVAGSYVRLVVQATNASINASRAILKVVLENQRCQFPALGTYGTAGLSYTSFSLATGDGSRTTGSGSATNGLHAAVNFFLTLPTLPGTPNTTVVTQRRLCFMPENSIASNWVDLGRINVMSYPVGYTVDQAPVNGKQFMLTVKADGGVGLTTGYSGDAVKIVPLRTPCASNETGVMPFDVTSYHAGLEIRNSNYNSIDNLTRGITYLGPAATQQSSVTVPVTLPGDDQAISYRVCYRLQGNIWMEVMQTPVVNRTVDLGDSGFITTFNNVFKLIVNSTLTGGSPGDLYNYGGFLYPNLFIAGSATTFDPTTIGGSGSAVNYFSVTGSGLSTSDTLRIVTVHLETQVLAAYATVRAVSCADSSAANNIAATYNPVSVDGSAQTAYFEFLLPITPGRYMFCYQKSGSSDWFQPGNPTLNPAIVISSAVYGRIGASDLLITDGMQSLGANLGSLSTGDHVYLVLSTAKCGLGTAFDGSAIASSVVTLTSANAVAGSVYNALTANSPSWYPVTVPGLYSLCFTKAIDSKSVQSAALRPVLSRHVWYRIPFYNNGYFENNFRKLSSQATLAVTCPSTPQTTGTSFDVQVSMQDPTTLETLTTPVPVTFTVANTNSWTFINEGGSCSGSSVFNHSISSKDGTATFALTALSACPGGTCSFKFSSASTSDSSECSFSVNAANAIDSIQVEVPSECALGSPCKASLSALDGSDDIVYGSSDSVSLALVGSYPGLGFQLNGGATVTTLTSFAGSLVNGQLAISFYPVVAAAASWPTSSPFYNVSITATIGSVSQTIAFSVLRPSVTSVAISSITMVNWDGTPANDVDTNQHLRWEPAETFGAKGFWDKSVMSTTLRGSAAYPWLAGQYYMIRLVPLDPLGRPITDVVFTAGTSVNISLATTTGRGTNLVIGQPANASDMHSFQLPIANQTFAATTHLDVIFRLRNADGCSIASPCSIVFDYGAGIAPSVITTPVRSVARRFVTRCGVPHTLNSSALNVSCPASAAVERGITLAVRAVDQFGDLDEFFNGAAFVKVLIDNQTALGGIFPTSVSQLKQRLRVMPPTARFVNGEFLLPDFTLTKPCANCVAQVFSDGNVGYGYLNLHFAPSTVRLSCTLSRRNTYYVMNSAFNNVQSVYNATTMSSLQSQLMVYPTTDLCFDISAVSSTGEPTLYEDVWVNFAVSGQSGSTVSATPSASTPYVYRPLNFSEGRYCMNVQNSIAAASSANFFVVFIAQQFSDRNHWASTYETGQCVTPTYRLSSRRLIAGLRLTNLTGTTPVSGAPASQGVWGRTRLADINQQFSITIAVQMLDHYGNAFSNGDLISSQSSFFLTPGGCSNAEISGGQCNGNGSPSSKLSVLPQIPIRDGGVLSVVLQTASYTLISDSLFFTFNVRRWCLKCDIPIVVFSGQTGSAYVDPVIGTVSSRLALSFLMPTSVPLHTAFRSGNSPFFPSAVSTVGFVSTRWRHWLPTDVSRPSVSNGNPMLFFEGCFNGTTSGCSPNTNLYSYGKCASANPEVLTGADGGFMQLVVYRSIQAMSYGESICTGDCFTSGSIPTSQIDIFNNYSYQVTVGSQRLKCVESNAECQGDGTGVITVTIPALGATEDAALVNFAARGDVEPARLKVVGVDASSFTTTDAITGAMLTGSGLASKAGPLVVSSSSPSITASIVNLTSVSGTGSSAGRYFLMWRGPARATKVVVRDAALDMACPPTAQYLTYASPSNTSLYTGYLTPNLLEDVKVEYAKSVIPINTPFPFTVEIQDTNNNVVPSASGTIDVSIVDWTGCGNGGSVTIHGSNAFSDGRATLWISFSDSCENCNVRFDLNVNSSQSDLYELVMNSAQKQSIVVSGLVIAGVTQGKATAAFATRSPTLQPSRISIDDSITISVAAFFDVGGIAIRDNASDLRIEAYNVFNNDGTQVGRRQFGSDGGFLRLANETLNFNPARVFAVGTGAATLHVAFQRACQYGCRILVAWRVLSTKAEGSFFLANADGQTFFVTAPTATPMLVSRSLIRRTIRYSAVYPYAVRVALSSATIPFAGWDIAAAPTVITPSVVVVDSSDGSSGVMTVNISSGFSNNVPAVVYHLNFSEPCYECRLHFNPSVNFTLAIQPLATQLRVNALAPSVIDSDQTVVAELFAADDMGFVDFSIGGQIRCEYEIPFLCAAAGRSLTIAASQDGVRANNFAPSVTTYHVGGTSAPTFALTPVSGFSIRNGKARLLFNATGPASRVVPIFTDGVFSTAPYPTFGFSINAPLTALSVALNYSATATASAQVVIYEPFDIRASMTFVSGDTRYVAPNANHTLLLTTSGECNMYVVGNNVYQRTRQGEAVFTLVFTAAASLRCTVTIKSVAGNGVVVADSASVNILSIQRVATSWDFLRPTPFVGGGTAVLFAAMTRTLVLDVQLYNLARGRRTAQTCSGCALLFTPNSCSPSPTFSPSGGAIFNSNGTATLRVTWQISRDTAQNSTIRSYNCTLSTSISGTSIDGPYASSYRASVCYPDRLVFVNSTFDRDVYQRHLYTSKAYTFIVASVDPYGTYCAGDSQYDVSTVVDVSLEYADGTPVESDLQVINLNRTSQSVNARQRSYNNTVYLLDGLFHFRLVFTNASMGPVRLRFRGRSVAPAISMSITTPPFQISQAITGFSMFPSLPAVVSSVRYYNFLLYAGDMVPFDWLGDNRRLPNIYESSADYYMMLNRSFFAVNPLTFANGSAVGTLTNGTQPMSIRFTVPDGFYNFYFFSRYSGLRASSPVVVRVETPYRFAFVTIGFHPSAGYMCVEDCFMPTFGTAFDYREAEGQLTINTPRTFQYAVALVDENDAIITSETDLTVGCAVLKDDNSVSANIAFAPSLVQVGPLSAPLVDGMANFSIGFIGSTLNAQDQNAPVRIHCYCTGERCPTVPTPTTLPIIVTTIATSSNITNAIGVTAIFNIPTTLTSISQFNATRFRNSLLVALSEGGITYIQPDNAAQSLLLTVCEVRREFFGFASLRGSVCGPQNICSWTNQTLCPLFVYRCLCPSDTMTAISKRELDELDLTGTQVQVELNVTLASAPAFQPGSAAEVSATYLSITHTLFDSLSTSNSPLWNDFAVLSDTIVTGSSTDPVVGVTQTPEPASIFTPVPATPVPSAASQISVWVALLCLLAGALL